MKYLISLLFFVVLIFPSLHSKAYVVIERNLEQIESQSELVFSGKCTNVETKEVWTEALSRDLVVTEITFSVAEWIKGDGEEQFSFRIYGSGSKKTKGSFLVGSPKLEIGQEYVLFVSEESRLKVRNIVGFAQGVFEIKKDQNGKKVVTSKYSNKGLFKNLSKQAKKTKSISSIKTQEITGPIEYGKFKEIIKELD